LTISSGDGAFGIVCETPVGAICVYVENSGQDTSHLVR
jgi:hypothetical protein